MIEMLKDSFNINYTTLAAEAGISYATLMRWKRRIAGGQPALRPPGPKKTSALNLRQLEQDIGRLHHGTKRTCGSAYLHRSYAASLSRREINTLVRTARLHSNGRRAAAGSRVVWHAPNLAWALDGSEYRSQLASGKLHMQNLQDLCSRYKFVPLTTHYRPCGEEISGYLAHQFDRFGPPLFCKRDNGGNLNHLAVDSLLEQALVIPINSPVNTPPYNGAIEHAQAEMKGYLRKWERKTTTIESLGLLAETASHDLNHQARRVLNGRNACQTYFGKGRLWYTKPQRKAIYQWIRDLAAEISIKIGKNIISPIAWRMSAKKWLEKNGLITIHKAGEVLPHFPSILCHK